jgi:hypothetical protein
MHNSRFAFLQMTSALFLTERKFFQKGSAKKKSWTVKFFSGPLPANNTIKFINKP